MKIIFRITLFLLLISCLPVLQAQHITQAEYFYDTDPGAGNAIAITVTTPADSVNLNTNLPLGALGVGFHFLYIRLKDANGIWGLTERGSFVILNNQVLTGASPQINAGEYFFDTDPGEGSGTPIVIGASADSVNVLVNIPLGALSGGFHRLYARFRYTSGVWGLTESESFYVIPAVITGTSPQINAAEYYFDTDPGVGNGTALTVGGAADSVNMLVNIPAEALAPGFHHLYIRYRYTNAVWGLEQGEAFYIIPPGITGASPQLNAMEYFIDTDPGIGSGTAIAISPAADSSNMLISVPVNALANGTHYLYIRHRYTNGVYGLTEAGQFVICQPPPAAITANASTIFCTGGTVTLNANTGDTLSWQWQRNGVNISGATDSNLVVTDSSGSYTVFITDTTGCTALSNAIQLAVNQPTSYSFSQTICPGTSYNFNGAIVSAAGSYQYITPNSHGCDSVITLNLSLYPNASSSFNASICQGGSYFFNEQNLIAAGSYNQTFTSIHGCDSVVTLVLSVTPPIPVNINASICSGSSYSFNGQNLTQAGTYRDTTLSGGCDSITVLALSVSPPITNNISASVCIGGTYNFNGQILNTAGTYRDTLNTSLGCDSIVILTLGFSTIITNNISATICYGSTYAFNGQNLGAGGVYNDTLTSSGGCDSVVILSLTVSPPMVNSISASICGGSTYNFNGQILSAAGVYADTLSTGSGCDSIVVLTLSASSQLTTTLNAAICSGNSYDFNGQILSAGGIYNDTLTSAGGCDSIVTLTLAVSLPSTQTINASICTGSIYNFNGQELSSAGTYTDTLSSGGGCDSIIILNLQVGSFVTSTAAASICQGSIYSFNGSSLSMSGVYVDTLSGIGGCDSIVTLTLTVNPQPVVNWSTQANTTVCVNASPVLLTATPWGGAYTGTAVQDSFFLPGVAGIGPHILTYIYTNLFNCSNGLSKTFMVLDATNSECTTGVGIVTDENALLLYPNPVSDLLTAESAMFQTTKVEPVLYDATGKQININYSLLANKIVFNTQHLSSGFYWLRFNMPGKMMIRRFIKTD